MTLKQQLLTLCKEQADIVCHDKAEREAMLFILITNGIPWSPRLVRYEEGLIICLHATKTHSINLKSDGRWPKVMAKDLLLLAAKTEEANTRFAAWPIAFLFIAIAIALVVACFYLPKAQKPVTYSDEQSFQDVIDSLDSVYWIKNAHSDSNWDASP